MSNKCPSERLQRLRFVAAIIVRFSGDKSNKEESAGCFGVMGIVSYGISFCYRFRQALQF